MISFLFDVLKSFFHSKLSVDLYKMKVSKQLFNLICMGKKSNLNFVLIDLMIIHILNIYIEFILKLI